MTRNRKVDLLRSVPLFSQLSGRELQQVARLADEIDLREGKLLIKQGDRGREFFVLLDGHADVVKDERRINRLGPGDFFGEIALVARSPLRTASVVAITPLRALVITEQNFRRLLEQSPQMKLKVLEALAARVGPAGVV